MRLAVLEHGNVDHALVLAADQAGGGGDVRCSMLE
jgi:hypothetical protein